MTHPWIGYLIAVLLTAIPAAITFIWGYSRVSGKIEDLTAPDGRLAKLEKYVSELYQRTDSSAKFESAQEEKNKNHSERYERIEKKLETIEGLLRMSRRDDAR